LEVDFPIVLNDIGGEKVEEIEIVNSMIMLPKTRIEIKGNRMVGAALNQQKSSNTVNNSSDIIANFLSNSKMSKIELAQISEELNALIEEDNKLSMEEIANRFFGKSKDKDDKYPDIFVDLFCALANEPRRNEDALKLLLMVTCKAGHEQKMVLLKTLLCNTTSGETKRPPMQKDRFIEIF
jgi:hypothetical protein